MAWGKALAIVAYLYISGHIQMLSNLIGLKNHIQDEFATTSGYCLTGPLSLFIKVKGKASALDIAPLTLTILNSGALQP